MSAFVVPRAHVAALTRALAARGLINVTQTSAVADDLMRENCLSVSSRYNERPESSDPFRCSEIATARKLSDAEAIAACECYMYQACEHDAWPRSMAHALIMALEGHATRSGGTLTQIKARNAHSLKCWPIYPPEDQAAIDGGSRGCELIDG